jgi:WD40 repeat protein
MNPILIYSNGNIIVEGGFFDGKIIITNLEKEKDKEVIEPIIISHPFDILPIISLSINNEENFVILSNSIGVIYIYHVDKTLWNFKYTLINHNKCINNIFISNDMNAFVTCSNDNFVNIITMPLCKLIRSFNIKKPKFCYLSENPLPVCLCYSDDSEEFIVNSINGHFICKVKENNFDNIPIFFTDYKFCDYIIYLKNSFLVLRSLPYLEEKFNFSLYNDKIYYYRMDIAPNKNSIYLLDEDNKFILILKDNPK